MSRRCLCSRLLAALHDDPRLATLPLSLRMLFLLLAEAAARSPEVGVIPFASPVRVSLLVSCSETEAETGLETLAAEDLIRRDGGRIAVPLVQAGADRATVARVNGARGGRPRKGETADAARERRQGSLLLPIGPAEGAGGKPNETDAAKPPASRTTTGTSEVVSRSGADPRARATPAECAELGAEVVEVAGLDQARGSFDYRPVQVWLDAGHSRDWILGVVAKVAARRTYDPRLVKSLRYFDHAMADGAGVSPAALPPPRLSAEERERERRELEELNARADRLCGVLPVSAYGWATPVAAA